MEISGLLVTTLVMSALAVILFLILINLLYRRNKIQNGKINSNLLPQTEVEDLRNRLSLALNAGNLTFWSYDVEKESFNLPSTNLLLPEGMTKKEMLETLQPEDKEKLLRFLSDLVEGKEEKRMELFRETGIENKTRWFEIHATRIKEKDGKIRRLIGTQKEITVQAEREEALRKYIRRTELAIHSANIIQWDYDVETRKFSRLFVDPAQPDLLVRKPFNFTLHPEDRLILEHEKELRGEGKDGAPNLHLRVMLEGETEYRWVNSYVVPLEFDENKKIVKLTGLQIDVTPIEKAEESNRMKSAFLANMSHEIRTPLNAITGFSQLLTETNDKEEQAEFIRIIENNNNLLLHIINDILDLSKIEAGKTKFSYTDFDLSEVFLDLEQVYNSQMPEEVKLICNIPYKKYLIHSEKNRLTQVLSNLLSNAVKFTFHGSITMGYNLIENGIAFYVTDTGKGIKQENLSKIFDRFTKLDSFIPGTGLGLAICQQIVYKLGGQISAESEDGKGSTFRFTIRCEQPDIMKPTNP